MRRQPDDLRSTRQSRSFYPVNDPQLRERMRAVSFDGYYTYLLNQDLDFVMPYELRRGSDPTARVVGPDADRAAPLIEQALSGREWTSSLYDTLRSFVSSAAQHLVLAGPTAYEIDYLYPAAPADPSVGPTAFRLEPIAPGTFAHHGNKPIQYVLATLGSQKDETGLTYVELDPETLITIRFDQPTETAVRKMVDFLRAANLQQPSEGALMEQSMRGTTPYNFSRHQQERGELFATVTEPIGWNVRGLFTDNRLEPYNMWRELRFLEFKIRLRDLIIDRLNQALRQVGGRLGFEATIELSGLPTLAAVEEAKGDLRTGRRGLGELAKFVV